MILLLLLVHHRLRLACLLVLAVFNRLLLLLWLLLLLPGLSAGWLFGCGWSSSVYCLVLLLLLQWQSLAGSARQGLPPSLLDL